MLVSPVIIIGNLSYKAGRVCNSCFDFGYGEKALAPSILFAVFGLPIVLALTAILAPIVFLYRAYVIIMIVVRNFVCCCCL